MYMYVYSPTNWQSTSINYIRMGVELYQMRMKSVTWVKGRYDPKLNSKRDK